MHTEAHLEQPMEEASVIDPGWKSRWAVVLAGGDGIHLKSPSDPRMTARRATSDPSFGGNRTILQQTYERALAMVAPEQMITVIGRDHRQFLTESSPRRVPGTILEQPTNLGTAPGILLPAAFISEIDPEATVLILPANQFVYPEKLFLRHAAQAFQFADVCPDRIIVVGVPADRPETGYGWILADEKRFPTLIEASSAPLQRVVEFKEKPNLEEIQILLHRNALWSTMVIAVKVETLWALARKCLPAMMASFEAFRQILRAVHEGEVEPNSATVALDDLYGKLQPADFSKDILQHIAAETLVMPMTGVTWYDWGRTKNVTGSPDFLSRTPSR